MGSRAFWRRPKLALGSLRPRASSIPRCCTPCPIARWWETQSLPVEFLPLDATAGRSRCSGLPCRAPGAFRRAARWSTARVQQLPGSNTAAWVAALRRLEVLGAKHVVPGFGSWGGPEQIARQRRFLAELRRQVGYQISQGRPRADLLEQVRLPSDDLVWMPYDNPTAEDIEYVYREMTVPMAPFGGHAPASSDRRPHALILIGDQPHEPGHVEEGLQPVFDATGVVPHFTVDVRALSAASLAKVQLLVILRDGLQRPDQDARKHFVWMTPEQQRAVAAFVERGGGFLNLHNALGLYPPDGPYLDLVGGRYVSHGPLERFRVEVVDAKHPVTRRRQRRSSSPMSSIRRSPTRGACICCCGAARTRAKSPRRVGPRAGPRPALPPGKWPHPRGIASPDVPEAHAQRRYGGASGSKSPEPTPLTARSPSIR